jgi:hypothetical protein
MANRPPITPRAGSVAAQVRLRIEQGGPRLWRLEDFADLSPLAVAQALSRLARGRAIERLSKGTYYSGRETPFGRSRPSQASVQKLAARRRPVFPAGLAAANLLGFTTQTAAKPEFATSASHLPRKLMGEGTLVHTRRPAAWAALSETDAALLDFLRHAGLASELTPAETVRRTLLLLGEGERFRRLAQAAATEPPRVRAVLGALGAELGKGTRSLQPLRSSLNPLSRFDFGAFKVLAAARDWQAKE